MGYTDSRPDFSNYLAHFTTNRKTCSQSQDNPTLEFQKMNALERLISILDRKKIIASTMPWIKANAVCFTECPWSSLLQHTKNYSSYGIGFTKPHIYVAGGGPALYLKEDLLLAQQWDSKVKPFMTPFIPPYSTATHKKNSKFPKSIDYTHEREWRVPHDFTFNINDIQFIVVAKNSDIEYIVNKIKWKIPKEKFLSIEMYKKIESLWPTHIS